MIDIKLIRNNPTQYKEAAQNKNINPNLIDKILELDKQRKPLIIETEKLQAQKNEASKNIAKLQGVEKQTAIQKMKDVSTELKEKEILLKTIETKYQQTLLLIPQPALEIVPIGKDDTDNVEIRKWGELPNFDFKIKDHVTLGEKLNIIDIPRGVKISGARFYYLKNEGTMLEWAILQYTLQHLVSKGFCPMTVPVLVREDAMIGTSYFPGGEDQAYTINKDDLYLVGTAEVALTSYHGGEILSEKELPKKSCALSSCFRREAGTYGKDTRGLYRIHQFQKVEQVIICKNDPAESKKLHQELLNNAEEVLQALKLPYRVVDVCTGDMGQGQVYKNDIETWMPSRNSYGETHSCSTFYDFQARRLKLRYKDSDGKTQYCHTLNNTCIASPRILIPLLEIYQNKDGSITIPEVLRPFMGGKEKIGD